MMGRFVGRLHSQLVGQYEMTMLLTDGSVAIPLHAEGQALADLGSAPFGSSIGIVGQLADAGGALVLVAKKVVSPKRKKTRRPG